MAKTLLQKYNDKKEHTLRRRPKVGFLLSLEEYSNLITKSTVCDYTGEPFTAKNGRSIERIDSALPYQVDNCCCVSIRANYLKDVIDNDVVCELTKKDMLMIGKIEHTLKTKTRFELAAKYNDLITTTPEEKELKKITEVDIAKGFVKFYEENPDTELSFKSYAKLVKRKTCMWSGKIFSSTGGRYTQKTFTKKDQTLPHSDSNTIVVCLALATIVCNNLFTTKQLTKFMER